MAVACIENSARQEVRHQARQRAVVVASRNLYSLRASEACRRLLSEWRYESRRKGMSYCSSVNDQDYTRRSAPRRKSLCPEGDKAAFPLVT